MLKAGFIAILPTANFGNSGAVYADEFLNIRFRNTAARSTRIQARACACVSCSRSAPNTLSRHQPAAVSEFRHQELFGTEDEETSQGNQIGNQRIFFLLRKLCSENQIEELDRVGECQQPPIVQIRWRVLYAAQCESLDRTIR